MNIRNLTRLAISTTLVIMMAISFSSSLAADPVVVSGGADNDYESWIEKLNDGRLMVVFDRNPDWASGELFVTFSDDEGVSWTDPRLIISAAGDQATLSFVQYPTDTLRLWYASNETGSYGIHSARSIDGVNWTTEGKLDLGWGSTTHYDPTVVLEADGSLTMSYVVSGSGVFLAHHPVGGTWDTDRTQVDASGFRARVMKHSNGRYLYAYHKRTGGSYDYDVFVTTSTDRVNWSTPLRITTNLNSHDPFAGEATDGAYLLYYAKYQAPAYNLHRRKSYDALTWEPEESITMDAVNNTQPHFVMVGDQINLVWAHAVDDPDDHDVYFERSTYVYSCCDLRGDINHDGIAPDIADLIYLVTFMFQEGPEPPCMEETDVDGNLSETPDIADLIYLVTFMFQEGPALLPCTP